MMNMMSLFPINIVSRSKISMLNFNLNTLSSLCFCIASVVPLILGWVIKNETSVKKP